MRGGGVPSGRGKGEAGGSESWVHVHGMLPCFVRFFALAISGATNGVRKAPCGTADCCVCRRPSWRVSIGFVFCGTPTAATLYRTRPTYLFLSSICPSVSICRPDFVMWPEDTVVTAGCRTPDVTVPFSVSHRLSCSSSVCPRRGCRSARRTTTPGGSGDSSRCVGPNDFAN